MMTEKRENVLVRRNGITRIFRVTIVLLYYITTLPMTDGYVETDIQANMRVSSRNKE